ncbi:2-oxoglutarate dehydrogenase E1 subunit family protein, partial [Arthrobacter sp. SO3]|uniref:2-oxoglutarate dehydrogenase E1 subunit family protein n=1 Tax=Arthrobacter sp. SO3 TaxID=1897057 RepID=UPI001CFFF186
MPEQPSHRLPEEFGGNEWLVDELYERYQQDKNTVDAKWWPLFESFDAGDSSSTNGASGAATVAHPTRELPVVAPAAASAAGATTGSSR